MKYFCFFRAWMSRVGLLLVLVLAAFGGRAQTAGPQVRVTVLPLPPYSPHLTDYVDQPNRLLVTLTNLSRQPLSLQLTGTLSGDNGVRAITKPGTRSPRPVPLDALQTRQLDREELAQLFDENQLAYSGATAQQIVRGNGLPEGTYTFCVRALDYATGQPLSAEEPVGCSRPFTLRSLEPPYIIKPAPDEQVRALGPQNMVFTWSRPAGAPPTTEYELRIVELSNNERNINDAFLAGTVPPLFERSVTANALLYGPAEPALMVGRRYAFAVTARDPLGRAAFRNNGRSEVQSFVYGATPAAAPATTPVAAAPPKSPKMVPVVSTGLIPRIVVRGQLRWGWQASEEAGSSLAQTAGLGVGLSGAALIAALDPSAGTAAAKALTQTLQGAGSGGASSAAAGAAGAGGANLNNSAGTAPALNTAGNGPLTAVAPATTAGTNAALLGHTTTVSGGGNLGGVSVSSVPGYSGPSSSSSSSSASKPPIVIGGDKPATPYLPAVLGPTRYPLAGQQVQLVYDYKPIAQNQVGWNDPILNAERHLVVGLGTTDAAGNFAITVLTAPPTAGQPPEYVQGNKTYLIRRLRVEVADPHFYNEPVGYSLKLAADGGYDLGETLLMAKSYRLKLALSQGSKPVTEGVHVRLLREADWYKLQAYARPEGQLPEGQRPLVLGPTGGQVITESNSVNAPLTRLFANAGSEADRYRIVITGDGFNDFSTTLRVEPAGTSFSSGVVTVTQQYNLIGNLPQVRGRVLRKHDNSPIAGANVRLTPSGKKQPFITQTDAQGRFVLANLPTSLTTDWVLEVLPGAGVAQGWKENGLHFSQTGPGSIIVRDPILIDASQYPLVGRIVNEQQQGLGPASLRWLSGGSPLSTDEQGRFLTTHQAGADTLLMTKLGYQPLKVRVWVSGDGTKDPQTGKKSSVNVFVLGAGNGAASQLAGATQSLQALTTGKNSSLQAPGEPGFQLPGVSPTGQPSSSSYGGGGAADPNNIQHFLAANGLDTGPVGSGQDLGKFILTKLVGRLRVTVLDSASGKPLAGAVVSFAQAPPALSQPTGPDGQTYFGNAPGGPGSVRVAGPANGAVVYVPALVDLAVAADGTTTTLTVRLAPGTRVAGTVTAGGAAVAGARVRVQGRPDLEVLTAANGYYELAGVPKGYWTLEAAKSGLVSQSQSATFAAGQAATLDFALTNAGFTIDKLLGFPIEVKNLTLGPDTLLTGAFVNLPGNPLFAPRADARLEFTNVAVHLGKNGVIRPKDKDFVLTDASELTLTAFQFLPIKIAETTGLKVEMLLGNPALGQLAGKPEINFDKVGSSILGWNWAQGVATFLAAETGAGPVPALPVLVSDVTVLAKIDFKAELRLRAPSVSVSTVSASLYGFTALLDLNKCRLRADGLHLAGSVKLDQIPGLGAAKINLSNLWIGTDKTIKTATLDFSPPVALSLAGFGFTLNGGNLTEQGFKLNGAVQVTVPSSVPTNINFSDLALSAKQIYGGKFVLPTPGLDVFGLAKFKPVVSSPLGFGRLPDNGPYFVSGGATTKLDLLDKELTIQSFMVRSDGKFTAEVPVDLSVGFAGLATLNLKSVKFKTVDGVGINVGADLKLNLPLVQAELGELRYRPNKLPALDDVGLHVPIGVGELGGKISFLQGGFGGALSLDIAEVITAKADFKYQKVSGDLKFSANIQAGLPPVPMGPGLALTKVGGGVDYGGGKLQAVRLNGAVSVLGFQAGLALNPIQVEVKAGPVVIGTADLTVYTVKMANAKLTLDFPKSLASVQLNSDYNPLKLTGSATSGAIAVVSGRASDTYWAIGTANEVKLLGLINVTANMIIGQNLNVSTHPELSDYTSFIDPKYLSQGTTVNGAHMLGLSEFGRTKDNAFSKCFWEACGKIWYYNSSSANLNLNFESGTYGMGIASGWGGGAELTAFGISIGGADVGAVGSLSGAYNTSAGWNINGQLGAHLIGWMGSCSQGCENKVCWGGCFNLCLFGCEVCPLPVGLKVCVHPALKVKYTSTSGVDLNLDL